MRSLTVRGLVCLGLCLLLAAPGWGQEQEQGRRGRGRGPGGRFGFGGPAMLLGIEQVQKELKITDEQKQTIQPILEAARPQRGDFQPGQNLSDEERRQRREERQKKAEEINKQLTAALTAEQNARLKQIQLQMRG